MGRLELHQKLNDILGSNNVYFQPPTNFKIGHPCIVYELNSIVDRHANNNRYKTMKKYTVTLIHNNPDTPLIDKLLDLPFTSFDRFYTADTLNHYVYTIYHK